MICVKHAMVCGKSWDEKKGWTFIFFFSMELSIFTRLLFCYFNKLNLLITVPYNNLCSCNQFFYRSQYFYKHPSIQTVASIALALLFIILIRFFHFQLCKLNENAEIIRVKISLLEVSNTNTKYLGIWGFWHYLYKYKYLGFHPNSLYTNSFSFLTEIFKKFLKKSWL